MCHTTIYLHCTLASCGAVYCNRSCLWVRYSILEFNVQLDTVQVISETTSVCVCCYHDNSKLRASILTKLGMYVKVVTISSWLNFGCPTTPGRGSAGGGANFFGCTLLQPVHSVCISLERFFHI